MQANDAIVLETVQGRQVIRLGARAGSVAAALAADRQRASEAVQATQKLGEDRAMSYLEGVPDVGYAIVP